MEQLVVIESNTQLLEPFLLTHQPMTLSCGMSLFFSGNVGFGDLISDL